MKSDCVSAQIWQLVDELMAVREKLQTHESLAISPKAMTEPRSIAAPRSALGHPAASAQAIQIGQEHKTAQGLVAAPEMDKVVFVPSISQEGARSQSTPNVDQMVSGSVAASRSSQADAEGGPGQAAVEDTSRDDVAQTLRNGVDREAANVAGDMESPAVTKENISRGEPAVRDTSADGGDSAPRPWRPIGRTSTDYTSTWSAKINADFDSTKQAATDAEAEEDGGRIAASWGARDAAAHGDSLAKRARGDSLAMTEHSSPSETRPVPDRLLEGKGSASASWGTGTAAGATLSGSLTEIAEMAGKRSNGFDVRQKSTGVFSSCAATQ